MKILKANAGPLTNFEVLSFLNSKGAAKDSTRVLAKVAPSEYKVYDYLVQTAACNQTRANIDEFLKKCKKFDLAKAEVLNIINLRPTKAVEIFPIIEECDVRIGDDGIQELVEMVEEVLAPPQTEAAPEPENYEGTEAANSEPVEEERDAMETS